MKVACIISVFLMFLSSAALEFNLSMITVGWILVGFLLFFVLVSVRYVSEKYRLVVFELGKIDRVAGPGLVFIIPIWEMGVKIYLPNNVSQYKKLTKEELAAECISAFKNSSDLKSLAGKRRR